MAIVIDPIAPTAEEVSVAKESSRRLASLTANAKASLQVQVARANMPTTTVDLPVSVTQLLLQILLEMGKGNAITLIPIHAQLTTQQAADFLGVSRPFLVKELRDGKLPFLAVGTHRRIAFKDLMEYREMCRRNHDRAVDDLVQQAQKLGMGY